MSAASQSGFPDLPIDREKNDALELDRYAQALAGLIEACHTPMTIGIQGDWGTGKTSLMNLIRERLDAKRCLSVWFNTWQYSQFGNEENLPASLLLNLLSQINESEGLAPEAAEVLKRLVKSVVSALSLSAKLGEFGAGFSGKSFLEEFLDTGHLDQATNFERMKRDFADLVEKLCTIKRRRKRDESRFSGYEELPPYERVVIYIDDLDRLPPVRAVELLEVIKNIIDVRGCVFVLAIDYAVVVSGLRERKHYGASLQPSSEDERKFFDKIIQVPFRMPAATYKLEGLLARLTEDSRVALPPGFIAEHVPTIIANSIGHNPRSLKRALNIHALFGQLLVEEGDAEVRDLTLVLTFVFACIQVAMPALYDAIATSKHPGYALAALTDIETLVAFAHAQTEQENDELRAELTGIIGGLLDEAEFEYIGDLRRLGAALRDKKLDSPRGRQRIRILAKSTLAYIDSCDTTDARQRLRALRGAITLAQSTVAGGGVEEEPEEQSASRFFGFAQLAAVLPDWFGDHPRLEFRHPRQELSAEYSVLPAYKSATKRLYVVDEAETKSLAQKTREVLAELVDEHGLELSKTELETPNAPRYWCLRVDGELVSLDSIREEYLTRVEGSTRVAKTADNALYDQKILELMATRDEPVQNSTIVGALGGTERDARQAFKRLLERGQIEKQGSHRGTNYSLVKD